MHDDLQVLIESLCLLGHLQPYERAMASMNLDEFGFFKSSKLTTKC